MARAPFGIVGSLVQRRQVERDRIVADHLRQHKRLERHNVAALTRFLREVSADILDRLAELGPTTGDQLVPAGKWASKFQAVQNPWWLRGFAAGANAERNLIEQLRAKQDQKTGIPEVDAIWITLPAVQRESVTAWLEGRNVGVWSKIESTLQKRMAAEMAYAIKNGTPIDELQKRVKELLPQLNKTAARRIARTETNGSMNFGHHIMREVEGVEKKEWVSTIDKRTRVGRFNHRLPNGQVQGNAEPFLVSGQRLLHPGDISLGATGGNVINCRCTAVADVESILKPRPMRPVGPGKKPKPREPRAVVPQPEPKPAPKPKKPRTPTFPPDPHEVEVVAQLGGSTGAELVKDEWGRKWVRKTGNSPEHIREEYLAEQLYRGLKVPVPNSKLYETTRGPVKLSRFIDDATPLGELVGEARKKAIKTTQRHFAADALLADWDVAGLSADNLLVDKSGKVWRIDVGASLRFRAQGGLKNAAWNEGLAEFWSLTEQGSARQVFEGMTFKQRLKSAERVIKVLEPGSNARAKWFDLIKDDELRATVASRVNLLGTIHRGGTEFIADGWKATYADRLMRHTEGLARAGYMKRLPTEMVQKRGSTDVFDGNGRRFDHLREDGELSAQQALQDYVGSIGGDWSAVESWASAQASDSWKARPQALKVHLTEQHTISPSKVYWAKSKKGARERYREYMTPEAIKAFEAQHASNWLLMDQIMWDSRSIDIDKRVVKLMRTEDENMLLKSYGIRWDTKKGEYVQFKRGAAESYSPFKPVTVHGSVLTVQEIPYTRIIGTYLPGRSYRNQSNFFYGDGENEFVAFAGDVPVQIIGNTYGDASSWTP